MKVLITGGSGFLGLRLAGELLRTGLKGESIDELVLADRVAPPVGLDDRVRAMVGDIADPTFVETIVTDSVDIIYHLAAIVSGQAEAEFDLGMRVNVDASRLLLDAVRRTHRCSRVIFTSSVAVFGPMAAGTGITDATSVNPLSSYGMEKAVAELLLREYSRRNFVDGVVLRLPTISVRPGRPNMAASSFASSIIREPLAGETAICPVPGATVLWLLSPRRAIAALILAGEIDAERLQDFRLINVPGISVTVDAMLEALRDIGGAPARALVHHQADPAIEGIVANWPRGWDDSRARALGFTGDADFASIVRAFIEDERIA